MKWSCVVLAAATVVAPTRVACAQRTTTSGASVAVIHRSPGRTTSVVERCTSPDSGLYAVPRGADSAAAQRARAGGTAHSQLYSEYDVVLDVPRLCVRRLRVTADSLTARLALDTRVANLMRVTAGADIVLGGLDLTIDGLQARALVLVDLDAITFAVDQTMALLDQHPELLQRVGATRDSTRSSPRR